MTSTQTTWKLGETRDPNKVTKTARAMNAIEAGDLVMLIAVNTAQAGYDGPVQVWKHAGTVEAYGVALYDAAAGRTLQILTEGEVKVTFKGSITHDGPVSADAGKVAAGAAGKYSCGWLVSGVKADGETGLVHFSTTRKAGAP